MITCAGQFLRGPVCQRRKKREIGREAIFVTKHQVIETLTMSK